MATALVTHPDCHNHLTPQGHPEQVARLDYILRGLEDKVVTRVEAPLASDEDLLLCHPQAHLEAIQRAVPQSGIVQIDGDTYMSPGSYTAALRAAGGALRAVDMVMAGEVQNAFVAMRPPGHHAETATPMGFCFFGNVALAAKHALDRHGLSRVAVVDFDVHHGNGTQDLLKSEARVLFVSSHQMPLWPGSGAEHETGDHANIMNVPLAPETDGTAFRDVYTSQVFPAVEVFAPEMIIISAGFDAHRADPLANINLETEDFAWVTDQLCQIAARHSSGRVVSCLEGGYDLNALAESAAAHVDVLIQYSGG